MSLAFSTDGDIAANQDVINDRLHLTLKEVISRIQTDLKDSGDGVGTPVKTVCERYFKGTAVSGKYMLF